LERKAENEFAARTGARAASFDRPAVQLDDGFDNRETNTQTGFTTRLGRADLNEPIEDPVEHLSGNANATVANRNDGHPRFSPQNDVDSTFVGRELRCVVQQVSSHLYESRGVCVYVHGHLRHLQGEGVTTPLDHGVRDLNRLFYNVTKISTARLQVKLSCSNAADVQQVLHNLGQLHRLAVNGIAQLLQGWIRRTLCVRADAAALDFVQ
jgi:hypothetical protein